MPSSGNPENSWNNFWDKIVDREIAKGERFIWVITGCERPRYIYTAVPDMPDHRKEAENLAKREKIAATDLICPYR